MRRRGGVHKTERSLVMLTETERSAALDRFHLIQPFLEDGVPLTHIAAEHHAPLRTLRRWVAQYRTRGLTGLIRTPRSDRGQRRTITPELQRVIEGMALQKPQRTTATIQREVARISRERGWASPSDSTVRRIISHHDPALTTLAHEGSKVYREEFDLIYRHQAAAPNEVWQADHSLLPILLLNEVEQPMKPWPTIILDD